MLSGRLRAAFFNRTRRFVAAISLEEKFCTFAAAQAAHRISIPSQSFLPPVSKYRRKSLQAANLLFESLILEFEILNLKFSTPIRSPSSFRSTSLPGWQCSSSAPLRRPATVVRNRRRVANRRHANTGVIDSANRRFTTTARTFHAHFSLLHAGFHRFFGCFIRRLLRREWSALARSAKSARARRRLG